MMDNISGSIQKKVFYACGELQINDKTGYHGVIPDFFRDLNAFLTDRGAGSYTVWDERIDRIC